jgi:hypothetical protein
MIEPDGEVPSTWQRLLAWLDAAPSGLRHQGIVVVHLSDRAAYGPDPDTFARARLFYRPLHDPHPERSRWTVRELPEDVGLEQVRGAVQELDFDADDEPVRAEGLSLLGALRDGRSLTPLRFTALLSDPSLTWCGSRQWLIEHETVVVLQVFGWC